jgi:hypothetical protein
LQLNSAQVPADDQGMSRLLLLACFVAVVVACAHAISATSSQAGATCGERGAPPAPRIDAVLDGQRVRVEYSVRRPAGCVADAVLITVRSVHKPDNVGPSTTNGLIRLNGSEGSVELDVPPLDLPPYEVRATSLTPRGRRSPVTTERMPQSADQCRGESCLQRAREKLERCLRGEAARKACPAYVWRTRPPVPYEPVQGVTPGSLEESFTLVLRSGQGGSVSCSSTHECVVTWHIEGEPLVARFEMTGYRQRAGCWVAERTLRLDDLSPVRLRGCVDWDWNQ